MASAASLGVIAVLWPGPTRDPLRSSAIVACRALAERMRADVAYVLGGAEAHSAAEHDDVVKRTDEALRPGYSCYGLRADQRGRRKVNQQVRAP
jgi:hypothetical protein